MKLIFSLYIFIALILKNYMQPDAMVGIIDDTQFIDNPFICINTNLANQLDNSELPIHIYYFKSNILKNNITNSQFKQRRIPNHGWLFGSESDNSLAFLISKNVIKTGFCSDLPIFSGGLDIEYFNIPLLEGMEIGNNINYEVKDFYYLFPGYDTLIQKHLLPLNSKIFTIYFQGKTYFFYYYFSDNEDLDSSILNESFQYINYPTKFNEIIYNNGYNFLSIYKKGNFMFKYGSVGFLNDKGKLIYMDEGDENLDGNIRDYFQILPLYLKIDSSLL